MLAAVELAQVQLDPLRVAGELEVFQQNLMVLTASSLVFIDVENFALFADILLIVTDANVGSSACALGAVIIDTNKNGTSSVSETAARSAPVIDLLERELDNQSLRSKVLTG